MAKAKPAKRRLFPIVVSGVAIVATVAVGGIVYWMNSASAAPAVAPAAATINRDTGAIMIGEGEQTVTEYVDFICPFCGAAHDEYSETLGELVESGDVTFELHPIATLDNTTQGTLYSTRAANATYCVAEADGDAAYPFYDFLFRYQPSEGSTGLDDDKLLEFAERAGVERTAVEDCVTGLEYGDFVAEKTRETPVYEGQSGIVTPTLAVNRDLVRMSSPYDAEKDILANLH